ncbi:MAG: energy transducer TonB [Phenylobacterium sp.]
MLAQLLALLAAAAAAPATPPAPGASVGAVSPVTVSPSPDKGPIAATVDMHGEEDSPWGGDFTAIWPRDMTHSGVDGHVILNCLIDAHGLAESCKVASETPEGKKLGRAALELRSTFKLAPATGADGQPTSAVMAIRILFRAPSQDFDNQDFQRALTRGKGGFGTLDIPPTHNPILTRNETMLDNPVWAAAATFDDLAAAYPAKGGGVEGYAAAHCRVERDGDRAGALRDCQIIKETPAGRDFGKAALTLAVKFRAQPATLAAIPRREPLWVDIPMRLQPPAAIAERVISKPRWIVSLDPRSAPKLFPPEAVAQGLTTGRGVARCTVGADGALTACAPEAGDPDGLGFSEAAVRIVSGMKMSLWAADGSPVEGGVVHIPIRLNLNGAN